jgi:hypothetical protein
MFKVDVDSSKAYMAFDPARTHDLKKLDELIKRTAPKLTPHFHTGTPAGEAGMRMKMLGYGKSSYTTKAGKTTPWPVIGVALQESYVSVYIAVRRDGTSAVLANVYRPRSLKLG